MFKKIFPVILTVSLLSITITCATHTSERDKKRELAEMVMDDIRDRTIAKAEKYLDKIPVTVTASVSDRSAGGPHDFYSEGDYWHPDPDNPDGPFIRKDGVRYEGRFEDDRLAMRRFAEITAALASAWVATGEQKYADHALTHMKAWFTDPETLMNPNMLYAQAIKGRVTGRSIGLIDAYHLVEVAQSARILTEGNAIPHDKAQRIKNWFGRFATWMTTHEYGIQEMQHYNNHAVTWAVTAAVMARTAVQENIMELCRNRFAYVLLPEQMDQEGKFPYEIGRTKPYGYSLFNIDAFANLAWIISTEKKDFWTYVTHDGKSLGLGMDFIVPYIKNKDLWPYGEDIDIWEKWPVRHSSLLFAGLAFGNREYIDLYLRFDPEPEHPEVLRNHPVRHPLIWMVDILQ